MRLRLLVAAMLLGACEQLDIEVIDPNEPVDATSEHAQSDAFVFGVCDPSDAATPVKLPPLPASCAPCPSNIPDNKTPCDIIGLACEYGTDPRLGCNPIVACVNATADSGLWNSSTGDPPACPPVFVGGVCASECFDADISCLVNGMACPPASTDDQACSFIRDAALGCPCTVDAASDLVEGMGCQNGRLTGPPYISPPPRP